MSQINNYPIVVDFENATFVVETESGTRRLNFSQLADYFDNIVNAGGIGEAKTKAAEALAAALSAANAASDAVEQIGDVIQKNIATAYIQDRHLYFVLVDETTIDCGIVMSDVAQYGVCINHNTGAKTLVRTDTASNMIAEYGIGEKNAHNEFDAKEIWSLMRKCTLADNGTVTSYEGDAEFVTDGSIGQVMIEYQKFYYKREFDESNNKEYIWFCTEKLAGYDVPPFFTDKDGNEVDTFYLGVYEMTSDDEGEVGQSIAGVEREKFKYFDLCEIAAARGTNWHNIDYAEYSILVEMAFLVEFATTDSESIFAGAYQDVDESINLSEYEASTDSLTNTIAFPIEAWEDTDGYRYPFYVGGKMQIDFWIAPDTEGFTPQSGDELIEEGATRNNYLATRKITSVDEGEQYLTITFDGNSIWSGDDTNIYIQHNIKTGETDGIVASSGIITENPYYSGSMPFKFRGLENPFSNDYTWVCGIYMRDDEYYVSTDLSHYGDLDGYRCIPEDAVKLSYPCVRTGFISKLGYDSNVPWAMMPTECNGTSEDGYCDKHTSASVNTAYDYVFRFGGSSVSDGGVFGCYANNTNTAARSATTYRGRLAYRHFE